MADLISKNELYKKGESLLNSFINGKKNGEQAFRDLFNAIADMPSVDTERHGHWDYYGYDEISNIHIYRCSECECGSREAANYCGNCGTKMDEVTE